MTAPASANDGDNDGDEELRVELLWELLAVVTDHVKAAREHVDRLPPIRSRAWLDAHPDVKVAALLVAGLDRVLHDPHQVMLAALREASNDVHAGSDWWRTAIDRVPHDELQRRRAYTGPPAWASAPAHPALAAAFAAASSEPRPARTA